MVAVKDDIDPNDTKLSIDLALVNQYFQEAKAICDRESGKLWGISLCGPILFADSSTRMVVANQSDIEGNLTKMGYVFVGQLPEKEGVANTSVVWGGVKWTMIVWPLPEDEHERAQLVFHESFHRIQDQLGLPWTTLIGADHLDSMEGRIWLQLELRALRTALMHKGAERKKAIEDALIFRSYRRELFPKADTEENSLEMNEGLAEYTGVKLRGSSDLETVEYLAKRLENAKDAPTFVRSFAYVSGSSYGILLDEEGLDWRKNLKPCNELGVLLQQSLSIRLPENLKLEAEERSKGYGGDVLRALETERESDRKKRIAEYRTRLVDGPVLMLPFARGLNFVFNPSEILPLEGLGIVYPTLRVTGDWGILTISNGALVIYEGERVGVYVPAPVDPNAQPLQGISWTLKLDAEWKIKPGERKGDYLLKKTV